MCGSCGSTIRGKTKWFAQLVQEGLAPLKDHVFASTDVVAGQDIGPSTIATVGEGHASLERFCDGLADFDREIRRLARAMDRSRRASNPENYNADGTIKPGPKRWTKSTRYRVLAAEKAEMERRLAAERKRAHGELANRTLAQAGTVKMERLSYRAFQRRFGRSVKRRAPGLYVSLLKRKAVSAGASVIEFKTQTTRLSQFDHTTGEYVKKPLSQRWHVFPDGGRVQRDLYSAWLARFVERDRLDASHLATRWAADGPLLRRTASGLGSNGFPLIQRQSASGTGSARPHVRKHVRGDRPPQGVGQGCKSVDGVAYGEIQTARSMKSIPKRPPRTPGL